MERAVFSEETLRVTFTWDRGVLLSFLRVRSRLWSFSGIREASWSAFSFSPTAGWDAASGGSGTRLFSEGTVAMLASRRKAPAVRKKARAAPENQTATSLIVRPPPG